MNKEELQKTLIKLFHNYQKEIKSLNYGEFTKATYFLLEKLKKYPEKKIPINFEVIAKENQNIEIIISDNKNKISANDDS